VVQEAVKRAVTAADVTQATQWDTLSHSFSTYLFERVGNPYQPGDAKPYARQHHVDRHPWAQPRPPGEGAAQQALCSNMNRWFSDP
jgi:hypothetical protein